MNPGWDWVIQCRPCTAGFCWRPLIGRVGSRSSAAMEFGLYDWRLLVDLLSYSGVDHRLCYPLFSMDTEMLSY
ncbi:hypothetical protein EV1_001073 [Malus domestica]